MSTESDKLALRPGGGGDPVRFVSWGSALPDKGGVVGGGGDSDVVLNLRDGGSGFLSATLVATVAAAGAKSVATLPFVARDRLFLRPGGGGGPVRLALLMAVVSTCEADSCVVGKDKVELSVLRDGGGGGAAFLGVAAAGFASGGAADASPCETTSAGGGAGTLGLREGGGGAAFLGEPSGSTTTKVEVVSARVLGGISDRWSGGVGGVWAGVVGLGGGSSCFRDPKREQGIYQL